MAARRNPAPFGLAALAIAAALAAPARGQAPSDGCPAAGAPVQLEVLPFSGEGNTCGLTNAVSSYNSKTCTIPQVPYSGPDAIYKVWLHEGNEVAFHLEPRAPADLVLALIQPCGNDQCVTNSTDFIGSRDEDISAAHYEPGIYYLVVDSAEGAPCGSYKLTVTGVNPTPDLALRLASSPEPAVAGESLTYTLTVSNVGALDATGVVVAQTLPEGVRLQSAGRGCTASGRAVSCSIDKLAVNAAEPRQIKVLVSPATRGTLASTASAKADQGEPTPGNNTQASNTTVVAKSDLSIQIVAPQSVVAGTPLTYMLRLHNAGPSDATQVKVTDGLGCSKPGGCIISRLAAGASTPRSITVSVPSSASKAISNTAQVSALEPDPGPGPNSDTAVTRVIRQTDLSVVKTGPAQVSAGQGLTYRITVSNHGPSDSSGAIVTDTLPPGVNFMSSDPAGCTGAGTVQCQTGEIANGASKSVWLMATVVPSLRPTILSNTACAAPRVGDERDLPGANDCGHWDTSVKVDADLALHKMTAQPVSNLDATQVIAGENLLYTVTVQNVGVSDSLGGTIQDDLTLNPLAFISSPDGCGEKNGVVSCPVPKLPKGQEVVRRFVVRVDPSATGSLSNQVCVQSAVRADDAISANDCKTPATQVKQAADLAVTLTDFPDAAVAGAGLTYTLTVTNNGPSDAAGVVASLTLPGGSTFVQASSDPSCQKGTKDDPAVVTCDPIALPAGATTGPRQVHILAPGARGTAVATASVHGTTPDPNGANDMATETTTLALLADTDLVVTKTAGVEAVVAGDLLRYTITVANHGLVDAQEVTVQDLLRPEATFVPELSPAGCGEVGGVVTCGLGTVATGEERPLLLTVRVLPGAPSSLQNTASIPDSVMDADATHDPNQDNNTSSVETPVLHVPPLVLPFFEVSADPTGVTTLLTVKNPAASPVGVRYDYFLADRTAVSESSCLPGKGTHSRNLREIQRLRGFSGHVGITPIGMNGCSLPEPPPALSGDFIRTDPLQGTSGLPLVSTDTSRLPPELCRRWSVRFLNDKALNNSSTELLFFVPGNERKAAPIARGKVYNEAGQLVQEISISDPAEAFRKTTRDKFDQHAELLASSGSIEWEFPPGVIGNVAAVHRAEGRYAVAVPGFCRDGGAGSSASPLIVPYFDVDPANPTGVTTLFAVRNETEESVTVKISYQFVSAQGAMLDKDSSFTLVGHAVQSINLRDVPELKELGRITGFVQIARTGKALSGDFALIDPHLSLAWGGALVDADPHRSPPQLCQLWDVRFLQSGPPGLATGFVFYLDGKAATATGQAYAENGDLVQNIEVQSPPFRVQASSLGLTGSGSIEWNLGGGVAGNLSTLFTSPGGSAVLVPGVCRDAPKAAISPVRTAPPVSPRSPRALASRGRRPSSGASPPKHG